MTEWDEHYKSIGMPEKGFDNDIFKTLVWDVVGLGITMVAILSAVVWALS